MPYIHEVFIPRDLAHAKDIVLSPDATNPTKFKDETEFLVSLLIREGLLEGETRVLDFGCGMGRVAKEVIERVGARVHGTDMSSSMRSYAEAYVSDSRFTTSEVPPLGAQFDLIIAVFVLQHTEHPTVEIERIVASLAPGGAFVLVDEEKRFVPSGVDREGYVIWNDDGFDVVSEVRKHFAPRGRYFYPGSERPIISLWKKR